jgi:hypothetical protein
MAYVQTISPGFIPEGYFDQDNVDFIKKKTTHVLSLEFRQNINIDYASIKRIMQRVLEERTDTIPKLNQRVIMYLTHDFRIHQAEVKKNLNWEANYVLSQRLYDPSVERVSNMDQNPKMNTRLGLPRVGGTMRFYFT